MRHLIVTPVVLFFGWRFFAVLPGETLTQEGEAWTGEAVERLSDVLDVV
jgi:hypothetical protein